MARQSKAKAEETPAKPPVPTFLGEPLNELTEDEISSLADDPEEFDIFMDVGDALTRAGDRITYTIKRDGEFIAGSVKHPFSWDQVQQKYGGGTFQVIARSTNKKGYVKSESRNVAPLTTENVASSEREEPSTGNNITELLAILQADKRQEREEARAAEERREQERREREERAEEERRRREEDAKKDGNSTMLLMMKMMEAQSSQTTALLTALITGGQKKEPDVSVEKIMSLMDARMEKVIALVQGKDKTKDIDALKLIELQSNAEERGYKRAMDMHNQAEKKAEVLAEMRENAGAPAVEKAPSTTKMLLEAVVPAVQSFMAARGGVPGMMPAAAPAAALAHTPAKPMNPAIKNQIVLRPPAPPRAPNAARTNPAPAPAAAQPAKEPQAMTQHERVEQTVFTEIEKDLRANLLTQKFDPEGTANRCLEMLKPFGITPQWLCSNYSLTVMMDKAKAKGVPDQLKPYIERFHAEIEAKTRVGLGEPSEGSQPANR